MKRWLKRAYRHHEQSRNSSSGRMIVNDGFGVQGSNLEPLAARGESSKGLRGTENFAILSGSRPCHDFCHGPLGCSEHPVYELLQLEGAFCDLAVSCVVRVAAPEQ